MKHPETALYVAKARLSLREASVLVANDLPEAAGRAAYLATFHAAQAYVFDETGRGAKSHNGVRSEFARLAKEEPRIERFFPTFLARAYTLKANADYAIGDGLGLTTAEAHEAIGSAERFVSYIAALLESGSA